MGAWIEIFVRKRDLTYNEVAPYMGAWIEIKALMILGTDTQGRTLHGCVD